MTSRERARYVARATKGDDRRERLLAALRELLEARPLADVGIAEISAAAGVTRSAFYFYFPTKAAAVAALLSDLRDQIVAAGEAWYAEDGGTPLQRVRLAVDASVALWRGQAALMAAMTDAAGQDDEARREWQAWIAAFEERIAARIEQERARGMIAAGSPSSSLATVLMGATLHCMERDVRAVAGGHPVSDDLPDALAELWFRTLYGA